jgi:hypothetical protein
LIIRKALEIQGRTTVLDHSRFKFLGFPITFFLDPTDEKIVRHPLAQFPFIVTYETELVSPGSLGLTHNLKANNPIPFQYGPQRASNRGAWSLAILEML